MDISWQSGANTATSEVQFSSRVDTRLDLYDKYGLSVFFNVPLSAYGVGPQWTTSVVEARPVLETLDKNGLPMSSMGYIRVDHPEFADQLLQDMMQLYSYYGHHPSWTGFTDIGGWASDLGYYWGIGPPTGPNNQRPTFMLGRESIINFANSAYCGDGSSQESKCSHLASIASDPALAYENIVKYHQKFERGGNSFNNWASYNQIQFLKGFDNAIQRLNTATGKNFQFGVWPFDPYMTEEDFDMPTLIYGSGHNYCPTFPPDKPHFSDAALGSLKVGTNPHINQWSTGISNCLAGGGDILDFHLRMTLPFAGGEPMTFGISQPTSPEFGNEVPGSTIYGPLQKYGQMLNRMQDVGTYFGSNSGKVKVLVLGGWRSNTPQFLTPALDITMSGEGSSKTLIEPEITRYGDFSQFDVIVIPPGPGKQPLSGALQSRIATFVQNGGGLVQTGGRYQAGNLDNVMGFISGGSKTGTVEIVAPNHVIFEPYNAVDIVSQINYNAVFSTPVNGQNPSVLLRDASGGAVMFTNTFGTGRSAFVPYAGDWATVGGAGDVNGLFGGQFGNNGGGSPRDSYIVILTNAILWAANQDQQIPAWWYDSPNGWKEQQLWSDKTYYSILGSPGKPPLAWFFTDSNTPDNVQIHLDASFFGVDSSSWVAISALNWEVVNDGSGEDIFLDVQVPARGWNPVYILERGRNLTPLYTNVNLLSGQVSSNSAEYTLDGPHGFSSWLILQSDLEPSSVSASNTGLISRMQSLEQLDQTIIGMNWDGSSLKDLTETGWYWDSSNQLLYIHFRQESEVTIDVTQTGEVAPLPPPEEAPPPPEVLPPAPEEEPILPPPEEDPAPAEELRPAPDGLVASYKFQEGFGSTTVDLSGNSNDGLLVNRPRWTVEENDFSLRFDGTNYVIVSDSLSLDVGLLTVSMSVFPTEYPSVAAGYPDDHMIIISKEDSYQVAIFANGLLKFAIRTSPDSWEWTDTSTTLPLNTWSDISITYDGVVSRVYLDNGLIYQNYLSGPVVSSDYPLGIGARYLTGSGVGQWGAHFEGRIDEVDIYNYALTADELAGGQSDPVEIQEPAEPQFNYIISTADISVFPGLTGSSPVDLILLEGTPEFVSVSITGIPSGVSAFFNPTDGCTPDCSLTLYVATTDRARPGSYTVTLLGDPLDKIRVVQLVILDPEVIADEPEAAGAGDGGDNPEAANVPPPQEGQGDGEVLEPPAGVEILVRQYVFTSNVQGAVIILDGERVTLPYSASFEDDTLHIITADQFLQESETERFRFEAWAGSTLSTTNTLEFVAKEGAPNTYSAFYWKQYMVILEFDLSGTEPLSPIPFSIPQTESHWVDEGETFEASLPLSPAYELGSWMLDSQVLGFTEQVSFEVKSSHILTARLIPRLYTIIIDPMGGQLFVDGSPITQSQTYQWTYLSSHTIEANRIFYPSDDTRLTFRSWSDGFFDVLRRPIVVNEEKIYSSLWMVEYRLLIETPESGDVFPSPGEHWYRANQQVNLLALSNLDSEFKAWLQDGLEINDGAITIIMDSPHTIAAVFVPLSFTVSIDPAGGLVSLDGVNWSNEQILVVRRGGDTVRVYVREIIPVSETSRISFIGWSDGDTESNREIIVLGDLEIRPIWETQFLLEIRTEHGSPVGAGWYSEGSLVNFDLAIGDVEGDLYLRGYAINGDLQLEKSGQIRMDQAHVIVFEWTAPEYEQTSGLMSPTPSLFGLSTLAMSAGGFGLVMSVGSLGMATIRSKQDHDES